MIDKSLLWRGLRPSHLQREHYLVMVYTKVRSSKQKGQIGTQCQIHSSYLKYFIDCLQKNSQVNANDYLVIVLLFYGASLPESPTNPEHCLGPNPELCLSVNGNLPMKRAHVLCILHQQNLSLCLLAIISP